MLYKMLERQGEFLFRWRGILPLVLIPVALLASFQSGQLKHWLGESVEEAWEVVCALVAFSGLVLRSLTVGFVPGSTSGRNTREQRAARLNTSGLYSVVRNPLYLGNFLILLGMVLLLKVWWFPLLAALAFGFHYERIVCAEEAFLQQRFGADYERWAAQTPAFLPDPRRWRRSDLPFSFRTALRREHSTLLTTVCGLTLIELVSDLLGEGETLTYWMQDDFAWVLLFVIGAGLAVLVQIIKNGTRWLVLPGR